MVKKTFKFSERAAQKQASREADAARLASGEVTAEELRKENAFIKGSGFRAKKIGFSPKYPSEAGHRYFTPDGKAGKRSDASNPQCIAASEVDKKSNS